MRVEKSWGYEQILHNGAYCVKLLVYTRPISSSVHYHEKKTESFFVHSGLFKLATREPAGDTGVVKTLKPGHFFHLPAGTVHMLRCIEPGTVVEASTHDDPNDCVRLVPSET
jgi:quercetin dioxygenase-like cupin family protein